jgi:D-alanyl-lipoteichoic acid acyltransferase DltB (MBOAT superfamily)
MNNFISLALSIFQTFKGSGIAFSSPLYIAILVFSPLLFRNNRKSKRYIFLILSILAYSTIIPSENTLQYLAIFVSWILFPFIAKKLFILIKFKYNFPIIIILVIGFAYLQQYEWIFSIIPINIEFQFALKILGISYILFRQIDFIMQYRVNLKYLEANELRKPNLIDYLNYTLSFYTIVCGPIMRYKAFVEDFYKEQIEPSKKEILYSINRILTGYLKFFFASTILNNLTHAGLSGISEGVGFGKVIAAFLLIFGNILFIYTNFSGSMDVIISFAKLAGFNLPENFNKPYLAKDMQEFWNRWHITLSQWVRDYVFMPIYKIGLKSGKKSLYQPVMYIALILTFMLAGIWHGSDLNYVIYGILMGAGVSFSAWYRNFLKKKYSREELKIRNSKKHIMVLENSITWIYASFECIFVGLNILGIFIH